MSKSAKLDIEFVHPLSDDPELSYTLPSRYYTDPDIFELEKERIFQRSWAYVCHASQVREPGEYASVNIAGEPYAFPLSRLQRILRVDPDECHPVQGRQQLLFLPAILILKTG